MTSTRISHLAALMAFAIATGTACSYLTPATDEDQSAAQDSPTTTAPANNNDLITPTTADLPDPVWQELLLELVPIAEFDEPTAMASRSGSLDYFVTERSGRVRVVNRTFTQGANLERIQPDPRPVLDLSEQVATSGDRGLVGLTFSSDGRQMFVSYFDLSGDLVVAEYEVSSSNRADLDSRRELVRIPQPEPLRSGGALTLGPDGFLYIGVGSGGTVDDADSNAQDTDTLLGAILRIDPLAVGDEAYAIPDGNPFVNGGGRPELWAYGLREPAGITFDPANGDLWVSDRGQDTAEEINRLPAATGAGRGANLGWNAVEGGHPTGTGDIPANQVLPLLSYDHSGDRCSVVGGVVARDDTRLALLEGVYLFGDACSAQIHGLADTADGTLVRPLTVSVGEGDLYGFGVGSEGEVLVLAAGSEDEPATVHRLEPRQAEE